MIQTANTRTALRRLKGLPENRDGIAITEFAFVAPVFMMMLMGIFDIGYSMYIQSALQGAVQEGARRASLENTLWTDIENRVNAQVRQVIPSGDPTTVISFTLDRTAYGEYSDVAVPEIFEDKQRGGTMNGTYDPPEPYTDSNGNGRWDTGEPFTDTNGNGRWEAGEPFNDSNGNGTRQSWEPFTDTVRGGTWNNTYDADEWFVDRNGNRRWDNDVGTSLSGNNKGGAQDVVSIQANITYKRIFPLWKFVGQPQEQRLTASTFLRNQPFSARTQRVGVRMCATTC